MKKIIATFLILIFSLTGVFAYSPSSKDNKILNKIYPKLDLICKKSEEKCEILKKKIDKFSYKYRKKENIYFLLTEISKYIEKKLIKNKNINIKKINKIICTKVSDWDTIHFKKDWKDYITRLIWIDSPENTTIRYWYTEKLWNKAKDYLNNLILNKEIQIEYDSSQARTDKYWRHLVYIFYKWENINKKMVEEGLAKEYTYNKPYKYQKDFLNAQKKAKKLKKGIWSLNIEEVKKVIKQIDDHTDISGNVCYIKWNINSKWNKIYHFPWCKSYNKTKITPSKWEKCFKTSKEAENSGWTMAWNCN